MEQSKIDLFLAVNAEKFAPEMLPIIKTKLETMSDESLMILQSLELRSPGTMVLVAFLLGWERFFLDDVTMGIIKVITCYGFGIWWLVDIFSAKKRTWAYNFKKFQMLG